VSDDEVVVVPDTHVLLHGRAFDQIPWLEVLEAQRVVLVLVPQVMKELDEKKNGGSEKLQKRAKAVSALLKRMFSTPGATRKAKELTQGVSLVLRSTHPRPSHGLDYSNGDDRIVGSVLELRDECVGKRVVVMTMDFFAKVKMESHDIDVIELPEAHRLAPDDEKKPSPPKVPNLDVGLLSDTDDKTLTPHAELMVGLSTDDLIAIADGKLLEAQPSNSERRYRFDEPSPPTVRDYQKYIDELNEYANNNAHVLKLDVGILNSGGAPAVDVRIDVGFEWGMVVMQHPPVLPAEPRPRSLLAIPARSALLLERPEFSFEVKLDGEGCHYGRFEIDRIYQSEVKVITFYVHCSDEARSGLSLEVEVLVGSPPSRTTKMLNVRLSR